MATLAAFMKYPCESRLESDHRLKEGQSTKKFGFFQSERAFAEEVAEEVGLIRRDDRIRVWSRHPLAFLVEAADDICYRIIDFEDGYRLGLVSFNDAQDLLTPIAASRDIRKRLSTILGQKEKIEFLRSSVVGRLIREVVDVFLKNEEEILSGDFDSELVSMIDSARCS